MTKEELEKISRYSDQLKISGGRLDTLTPEEREDLKNLVGKSMVEQGVATPEELATL
jgi:hypothetical protein